MADTPQDSADSTQQSTEAPLIEPSEISSEDLAQQSVEPAVELPETVVADASGSCRPNEGLSTNEVPELTPAQPPEAPAGSICGDGKRTHGHQRHRDDGEENLWTELRQLTELTAKYPEIGPPLAQLAFKVGYTDIGNQIVRLGTGKDGPGLEYYFVLANTARREHRFAEARKLSIDAIHTFVRASDEDLASDDWERLLHLVRIGYATLLYDEKDPRGDPAFVLQLREALPLLEARLSSQAFYHAMVAQTRWYDDIEVSERAWDRAAELDTSESTWNARGTWYKDVEQDFAKAERAYRKGIERVPSSPLLMHNLAQLLVDRAEQRTVDVDRAHRLLNEAEHILRAALREDSPKGLRRHIHSTIDRLSALRTSLPPRPPKREEKPADTPAEKQAERQAERQAEPEREPTIGDVLKGRVRSIAAFGAFVSLPGSGVGLLHKSEMAHEVVEEPSQLLRVGQEVEVKVIEVGWMDGKLRIRLSMKALLPCPEGVSPTLSREQAKPGEKTHERGRPAQRDNRDQRDQRGDQRDSRSQRPRDQHDRNRSQAKKPRNEDSFASLGEMLMAKNNQNKKP